MTTRSKKTSRDDMEIIAEKLDKLTDMMDSNSKSTESSLQELLKEIRELRKSEEFLEKQYEDFLNNMRKITLNKLMVRWSDFGLKIRNYKELFKN